MVRRHAAKCKWRSNARETRSMCSQFLPVQSQKSLIYHTALSSFIYLWLVTGICTSLDLYDLGMFYRYHLSPRFLPHVAFAWWAADSSGHIRVYRFFKTSNTDSSSARFVWTPLTEISRKKYEKLLSWKEGTFIIKKGTKFKFFLTEKATNCSKITRRFFA